MSKKAKLSSIEQRTVALLRKEGYVAGTACGWRGPVRKDFLGCIDVVAFDVLDHRKPKLVQCTSNSNFNSRIKKVLAHDDVCGIGVHAVDVEVWGFGARQFPDRIVAIAGKGVIGVLGPIPRIRE